MKTNNKIFIIMIILILGVFGKNYDFLNKTSMLLTFDYFVIYFVIPFLVIYVAFPNEYSYLICIRFGKKRYLIKKIFDYLFSLLLLFLYFAIIIILFYSEINIAHFLLVFLEIIIYYLAIFFLSLFLHYKGSIKYYSLFIGIIAIVFHEMFVTNYIVLLLSAICVFTASLVILLKAGDKNV